ncbi:NACHT, LRR and PYD domains-containing protein 3-like [Diadema antillarum]|uniref:NACHT, LRR and PYD domains-containing protein 3-like n=1 Tax=Diadema antillarum TaxID=105358 RepID=UPI003A88DB95
MASDHTIKECVDKTQSRQNGCTYQITMPSTASFNLTCVVSGFKPNISMLWTEESGKRLNSVVSRQKMLSDSTYERSETISISTEQGKEQTFMCIATGDSLNGTSTKEIILLPISDQLSGKRDNVSFIVGLIIGVSVVVSILFSLVGKFLQKYHPHFLPRKGCGWNPCWRRPERVDEEETLMLAPLSPSLTKEKVQQIKEELKAYYLFSRRKVTVDPLNFMDSVNLDAIYTNLSLLDLGDMRKASPITYEDLVINDGSSNLSKRLLIQGEGGVGKTTLCSKIAWDWCQGRILQDLDMVLVIPLRDVTDGKSIGSIVQTYLSDSNIATQDQIDGYISNNLNRILIVFDGFDEFNGKIEEKSSSEVIRILGLEQYKSCKVIVTTRPWRRHEFTAAKSLAEAYTFIRVDGFNKDNLSVYIEKYFMIRQKDTLAEDLIIFMEENDVIQSNMAPFPIYCAMLCLMWEEFSKERRKELTKMQTFSEIFGEMINFLEEHYASKACQNVRSQNALDHLKEADRAIQDISEIALTGLLQNNMIFQEDQFRECPDTLEICCRVGVLTIERDVINRGRRRNVNTQSLFLSTVSFPHKLFQEYIARVYIENMYTNNHADYSQLKNKLLAKFEQFRYLLYFISTLRNEIHLDIIEGLTKCAHQYFCVDVAFECHTDEAAKAVGERWDKYRMSPDMSEHTKSGVVFMVHCNQAVSCSLVSKSGKKSFHS